MVFVAGLVPLSACALLSSRPAECVQAMSQSPCNHMQPPDERARLSGGSDRSCCTTSQAPLPEMQYKAADVSPATTITVTSNLIVVTPSSSLTTLSVVENPSPPSLQSLLCTFLI